MYYKLYCIRLKEGCQVNESSFDIVIDVLAREIDLLRYQVKTAGDELLKRSSRVNELKDENEKLRAMIGEGREKHE